jgi:hypothetical protein
MFGLDEKIMNVIYNSTSFISLNNQIYIMNKRILLLAFFLSASIFIYAQPEYAIGIKGGFNYHSIGTINERAYQGDPAFLHEPNKELGFQLGGYFIVQFDKFFIRPELNYMSSKNNYDFPGKKSKWTTSKTEFPILIGYEIYDPVSIYAGPVFSFYEDTELEGVQVTSFSDGGPDLEKTTTNLMFGVMLKISRFSLDLRYEIGSKETQEELLDIRNNEYGVNLADLRSYKPNILSLSFNIELFRTNGDDIGDIFKNLFKGDSCTCLRQ